MTSGLSRNGHSQSMDTCALKFNNMILQLMYFLLFYQYREVVTPVTKFGDFVPRRPAPIKATLSPWVDRV